LSRKDPKKSHILRQGANHFFKIYQQLRSHNEPILCNLLKAVAIDTPVDLEIWKFIHTPPVTTDVTVMHDKSTVGLVETN